MATTDVEEGRGRRVSLPVEIWTMIAELVGHLTASINGIEQFSFSNRTSFGCLFVVGRQFL